MWDIPTRYSTSTKFPADHHQSSVSNRAGSSARARSIFISLLRSLIFFDLARDVLRSVRVRVPLRSAGDLPSAARNPLRIRERHRHRRTDPRGERAGEAGEDVLQTGRVQAGKLPGRTRLPR